MYAHEQNNRQDRYFKMTRQKHVLITGGNRGIGLETTRMFLDAGCTVTAVARNFSDFPLKDDLAVNCIEYDLENIPDIPEMTASLPPVDILINNAGVMYAPPWDSYPDKKRRSVMKINLEAPVALIQAVAPGMIEQKQGRIVNNASIAGHTGHPDIWYGITKAGLINLTKSFAKILGPHSIVVNAVAAGPVETDMLAVIPEARKQAIRQAVYTGRFAYADEIAAAMFWLATDCPEYINGTCMDINNGAFPR